MSQQTLVSVESLATQLGEGRLRLIDCRFDLRDSGAGRRGFIAAHLPGAIYADLDTDLSDLNIEGRGRHPLPSASTFSEAVSRWGLHPDDPVVVYDSSDGSMAARLWWMLSLFGHQKVAVLDGGIQAWVKAGGRTESGWPPAPEPSLYRGRFNVRRIASTAVVAARMATQGGALIDARAPERFRGEIEPIDRVAGHIPGAVNRPYVANLRADGRFKPAAVLREEFDELLGDTPPEETLLMCGSGVTACHHALAMQHAGLSGARVYAGSWSEWISDAARPVARS
ncbi:MAG: sulfurtransferase [Lysobacteraceae bacterium]